MFKFKKIQTNYKNFGKFYLKMSLGGTVIFIRNNLMNLRFLKYFKIMLEKSDFEIISIGMGLNVILTRIHQYFNASPMRKPTL